MCLFVALFWFALSCLGITPHGAWSYLWLCIQRLLLVQNDILKNDIEYQDLLYAREVSYLLYCWPNFGRWNLTKTLFGLLGIGMVHARNLPSQPRIKWCGQRSTSMWAMDSIPEILENTYKICVFKIFICFSEAKDFSLEGGVERGSEIKCIWLAFFWSTVKSFMSPPLPISIMR